MRFLSLLLASALSRIAAAELTFSATAVQGGKAIDTDGLEFVPIPPRSRSHFRGGDGNSTGARYTGGHKNTRDTAKRQAVSFSSDWCGVSQHVSSGNLINNVYGIFSAPDLSQRPGFSYPQYAAAWIGIDGASCQNALLQAGITTVLNSNGGQSASAWWEWAPNASYQIPSFPVKAGEWIVVNISLSSATNAQIEITNIDRDYSMTIVLNGGPKLCQKDVDWIVEDFFDANGKQTAFARFQDIWFEECSATTTKGQQIGLTGASMIYMGPNATAATCVAQPYDDSNFYATSQN